MPSNQDVFRLVYVSRNKLPLQLLDEQVERVLTSSRRNNASLNITGALLFSSDCFAQTLEGPIAAVEALFERIQLDTRHNNSVILQAGPVSEREFGEWSMAYAGRHDPDQLRFDALTGTPSLIAQGEVLSLLRGCVLRANPSLVGAG